MPYAHTAQANTKDMEEAAAEATDGDDDESNAVVTCTICLSAYEEEEVVSAHAASPLVAVCPHGAALFSRGTCILLSVVMVHSTVCSPWYYCPGVVLRSNIMVLCTVGYQFTTVCSSGTTCDDLMVILYVFMVLLSGVMVLL